VTRHVVLTVLLGGIAAIDATPVAQSLLSQPLVMASLLGLVWGEWALAMKVGIVLQVFAASTLPVGARTPEDYATGGVIGVATALAVATLAPFAIAHEACAMLGVLTGLVAATLGVPLLKWQRRRNEGLSRWVESEIRAGNEGALGMAHAGAVVLAFAVGVVFCAVFLAVAVLVIRPLVEHRSIRLARAWSIAQPVWLGLGLAHLLNAFVQRRFTRAALFGVGLAVGWILLLLEG
jgi:mannose/fructose/N-acetylgalactosamine-specific phosphotransferase system component IIC